MHNTLYIIDNMFEALRDYTKNPDVFTILFRKVYVLISKVIRNERHKDLFMAEFVASLKRDRDFSDLKFIKRLHALYQKLSKYSSYEVEFKSRKRAKTRIKDITKFIGDPSTILD